VPQEGRFTALGLLAVIVAYELLYWGAGTLVYPYIAHFYASRSLPPVFAVAGVQVVRSLIFVGAIYPLLRSGLRGAPLVLALIYGIIGGLAPLLPDNPYMPPDIRFYHAIETTTSNFIFGLVVGFLFGWRRPVAAQA
jgi:xanthine/uracil permease